MKFDINKFADEFKGAIDWMLNDEHGNKIREDLDTFKNDKKSLNTLPDYPRALYVIIDLIATKGYRLKRNQYFYGRLTDFIEKYADNFRTDEAKQQIIDLVGDKSAKNVDDLLKYNTLKEFTDNLYYLSNTWETSVLGEKGRDEYLRDFGFWDRIPMDRHEMRFIIRTGIYHTFTTRDFCDPLAKSHLHYCLTKFCSGCLKGKIVEGIDLGNAAGITDLFIWSYCAQDRYNLCGSTPKCSGCKLNNVCLYALTSNK